MLVQVAFLEGGELGHAPPPSPGSKFYFRYRTKPEKSLQTMINSSENRVWPPPRLISKYAPAFERPLQGVCQEGYWNIVVWKIAVFWGLVQHSM